MLAVMLVLGSGQPGTSADVPEVHAVRFGIDGERTRIVLDLSTSVDANVHAMQSPPRLFVDLPMVDWRMAERPQSRLRGLASGLRFGRLDDAHSRLVIDIEVPFAIANQIMLPLGHDGAEFARLVIDIEPDSGIDRTIAIAPPVIPRARPPRQEPEPEPRRLPVIAIDAGHGGVDPGAIAKDGTYEKTITLAMARELSALLEENGQFEPFLVRDGDTFIKLRERIAIARTADADLFISLHADSIQHADLRGSSVYTLSENASDREAARLARKENRADIIGGTDLSEADDVVTTILIDLSQRMTNNESIRFADMLVNELRDVTRLVRNTRRHAGFAVLKSPDMPSVLVELGYLSNALDAERLEDPAHRRLLGEAILQALTSYFGANQADG